MPRVAPLVLKLTIAALAAATASVGLAVAGVGLPSLPGHAGNASTHAQSSSHAGDVLDVIKSTPPSDRGCTFGQAVAAAARGSDLPSQAQAACGHQHSDGNDASSTHVHGHTSTNADSSAGRQFGQDTAQRAKGQRTATPEQRLQFGQDTSQGAQQLGGQPDSTPTPQGGPGTGEAQSQAGRSTGEQASGGHGP